MGTIDQVLVFFHPIFYVYRQIGVYIVIILNGIRRTGFAFHNIGVVLLDAVGRIIGHGGVFYHSGIPYVVNA